MLKGKTALLTGASADFGRGLAIKFAEEGISYLTVTARRENELQETKKKCIEASEGRMKADDILVVAGDITDEKFVWNLVDAHLKYFHSIDILVNNAGFSKLSPFEYADIKDFDQTMNVNVRSAMVLTQMLIPSLKETKGCIVNISSALSTSCVEYFTFFEMSKACLDKWTRSLAQELGPSGIRVNAVNPGILSSDVALCADCPEGQQMMTEWIKHTPLGRTAEYEEIANMVVVLSSRYASFMTGTTVKIDGGISLAG